MPQPVSADQGMEAAVNDNVPSAAVPIGHPV